MDEYQLIERAGKEARLYLDQINKRGVAPSPESLENLKELGGELPEKSSSAEEVFSLLNRVGAPATVGTTGGRYFGFVIGGCLPVTVAANVLAAAWDECAGRNIVSALGGELEEISIGWLLDLLGLPDTCAGGFVTGATVASFTALAAARHALLEREGWDVESQGLFGAPPIDVVVGEEVHVSVLRGIALLGLGAERVIRVPVDDQGRMIAAELPELGSRTIICTQIGNVNTGACDPVAEIVERAKAFQAWVHVDGAFGLWLQTDPERAHLTKGVEGADSWATDAHKWLNVPYDSGLVFCREESHIRAAMSESAAYLHEGEKREPSFYTPELSRRARGIEIWSALRYLGREGVQDLVSRTCRLACRFARRLEEAGYEVLNEVVSNQVLVSFGEPAQTQEVIRLIQEDGTCWCGGTVWQGRTAMRISVSSWATTDSDVDESLEAMIRIANSVC